MSHFDIRGREFDWFAVDGEGHVALFSTAGGGLAPDSILHDEAYFESASVLLEELLAAPATTRARRAPRIARGLRNDWRLFAERGGFGFDSHLSGGAYRRVARPAEAVALSSFPGECQSLLGRIRLPALHFARTKVITPEMLHGR